MSQDCEIQVWADWDGLEGPQAMGSLRAISSRAKEVFSFNYQEEWLSSEHAAALDPDLLLFTGPQYLADEKRVNFGLFLDSSPDRWGRVLMQRREAALARSEDRKLRRLKESDYLLGVHDEQRVGALRFTMKGHEAFLNNDSSMVTPPWTSLRELENASWLVQDEDKVADAKMLDWLSLLIAPGSSLGGARPKAGVRDASGDLWIAKFPGRNDDRDMGAWEWITWQLAKRAGLNVPEAQVMKIGRRHHTFLTRRFDRVAGTAGDTRLHFASAMTLLGYTDGADHAAGASYLELAEFISRFGADPESDLEELWRRIVFSIRVKNTDDHLRNHGFLLTPEGWILSPAYDLNPDPFGTGLTLNISENDNALSLELAREVAPFFRVKDGRAGEIIEEVEEALSGWGELAEDAGLPRGERENLAEVLLG